MENLQHIHMSSSLQVTTVISLLLGAQLVLSEITGISTKHCLIDSPLALQHDSQLQCPSPIDENIGSRPVDWSPWTHRPDCLKAQRDPTSKYCVYSNSQHGNYGISITTKPKTAAMS